MKKTGSVVAFASFVTLGTLLGFADATTASAQTRGFAIDRFDPSERGSDWFALESLDFRGDLRPAFGIVADYANRPLVVSNANGDVNGSLVSSYTALHLGGSLVLHDRLRLSLDLPIAFLSGADEGATTAVFHGPSSSAAVGDLRLGGDVRILGEYGSAFSLAGGVQLYVPTGSPSDYTGDAEFRIQPRVMAAGDIGMFTYAAKAGVMIRPRGGDFGGENIGSELTLGASAGVRAWDKRVTIGPEIFASSVFSDFFGARSTPVEALLGAHVQIPGGLRVGLGGGPGLSPGLGEPRFRLMGSVEWAPEIEKKPVVADQDGDGIPDDVDACPAAPGVHTDDPKTNGCPVVLAIDDRDHDGIADSEDACPDLRGVRTGDPKTNGCPADRDKDTVPDAVDACPDTPGSPSDDPKLNGCPSDRDKDGILDSEDACPDKPGVRMPDPKKNGCPPDRDGDGILDGKDACPEEPGPPNDDPAKNGCPRASVKNGQIRINEQIKFRYDKAEIDPASDPILEEVAKILKDHPEITKLRIEGHTDNKGSAPYNKKLSSDRAANIKKWLADHGVAATRMSSVGLGADKPLDTNATEEGRRNNRRVEFHIEGGPASMVGASPNAATNTTRPEMVPTAPAKP